MDTLWIVLLESWYFMLFLLEAAKPDLFLQNAVGRFFARSKDVWISEFLDGWCTKQHDQLDEIDPKQLETAAAWAFCVTAYVLSLHVNTALLATLLRNKAWGKTGKTVCVLAVLCSKRVSVKEQLDPVLLFWRCVRRMAAPYERKIGLKWPKKGCSEGMVLELCIRLEGGKKFVVRNEMQGTRSGFSLGHFQEECVEGTN